MVEINHLLWIVAIVSLVIDGVLFVVMSLISLKNRNRQDLLQQELRGLTKALESLNTTVLQSYDRILNKLLADTDVSGSD